MFERLVEVMCLENPNEETAFVDLSTLVNDGRLDRMFWFATVDAPSKPKAARLEASLLNGSQHFRSSLCLTLVVRWTETGL